MKLLRVVCLLAMIGVLSFGRPCMAADGTSSFNWTGPYIGLHIGYGWGDADTHFHPLPTPATFVNLMPTSLNSSPSGVVGGIQGGYNYQVCNFVFGIEADFSGSGMSGNKTSSPIIQNDGTSFGGGFIGTHQDTSWYGTLRPRVGYAVLPQMILYATGGLAYGEVTYSAITDFRPIGTEWYPANQTKTKVGWTVGAGAEYALQQHWTVKLEYLYMDLGSQTLTANPGLVNPPFQVGYKWNTTTHLFNVGVNYKF